MISDDFLQTLHHVLLEVRSNAYVLLYLQCLAVHPSEEHIG
jgi:hypothetical protein